MTTDASAQHNTTTPWPTLAKVRARYVISVLSACGGNVTEATRVLDIDRRTLYRVLEQEGTHPREIRASAAREARRAQLVEELRMLEGEEGRPA